MRFFAIEGTEIDGSFLGRGRNPSIWYIHWPVLNTSFSVFCELADVYLRLPLSFTLLMMDAESFGSILHHNGTVMRVIQVGMHAMKIK